MTSIVCLPPLKLLFDRLRFDQLIDLPLFDRAIRPNSAFGLDIQGTLSYIQGQVQV